MALTRPRLVLKARWTRAAWYENAPVGGVRTRGTARSLRWLGLSNIRKRAPAPQTHLSACAGLASSIRGPGRGFAGRPSTDSELVRDLVTRGALRSVDAGTTRLRDLPADFRVADVSAKIWHSIERPRERLWRPCGVDHANCRATHACLMRRGLAVIDGDALRCARAGGEDTLADGVAFNSSERSARATQRLCARSPR